MLLVEAFVRDLFFSYSMKCLEVDSICQLDLHSVDGYVVEWRYGV